MMVQNGSPGDLLLIGGLVVVVVMFVIVIVIAMFSFHFDLLSLCL